jgi:type III secretion protein J
MSRHKPFLWCLLPLLVLILCACGKVELYSDLPEKEANEMLSVLLSNGIATEKQIGKEQRCTLQVDKDDIARAVKILHSAGFPRAQFVSIGEVFKKEGLVSSPLEERVRFLYALSQEISETLSQIDGVLSARVHVVIPENDPMSDSIKPSSASVFIKYVPYSNVESNIPGIKKLVVNSIEGLTYEKVTVVLFESEGSDVPAEKPPFESLLSVKVSPDSVTRFWALTGGLMFLVLALFSVSGYLVWRSGSKGMNG